jgi:hypothetical protein
MSYCVNDFGKKEEISDKIIDLKVHKAIKSAVGSFVTKNFYQAEN